MRSADFKKVLLIDDDPAIRRIGALCLRRWSVATAASGAEGVARAVTDPPDLILLDMVMPDMDGPTVFRALAASKATGTIPVVLLTATPGSDDVERCLSHGAVGVLQKPFNPLNLADEICRLLDGVAAEPD